MPTPDEVTALKAARIAVQEFAHSDILKTALKQVVTETFEQAGMNISTPEAREKLRQDMVNLRTWNEFWGFVREKGIGTTVNWIITGALTALAAGLYITFWHK